MEINICGFLIFDRDSTIYELKGDNNILWDICTAVEEECSREEVPGPFKPLTQPVCTKNTEDGRRIFSLPKEP